MSKHRIYNNTLNPVLWDDEMNIIPEVSNQLTKIASDFYAETKIKAKLKDVYLIGSSANYNWTPHSDIDLHLVVDISELDMDEKSAKSYLEALKSVWNCEHDIKIKGYNVEGYIQDIHHQTHATGIYSLMKGIWVSKPSKERIILDKDLIRSKYKDFTIKISKVLSNPTVDKIKMVLDDLYKFRQTGLDKSGEFSVENVVFKLLRNNGFITRLKELKTNIYDREMSVP